MASFKGIRGRLLLALASVATLAFVAAVAAIWAFLRVGEDLQQIVERDVPASFNAYEMARVAEIVAAAAAGLVVVETPSERDEVFATAQSHHGLLSARLRAIRSQENVAASESWAAAARASKSLAGVLQGIYDLVAVRQAVEAERSRGLRRARELTAGITDQIRLLIRAEDWNPSRELPVPQKPSLSALEWESRFHATLMEASIASESQADVERHHEALQESRLRLENVLGALLVDELSELSEVERARLVTSIRDLTVLSMGGESLLAARSKELANQPRIDALVAQSSGFASDLVFNVELSLIETRGAAQAASEKATALQRRTSQLLFGIAAAAVLLTVLIGWVYVDRNLARRLRLIIDGATAIAGGNYDVKLPAVRNDELGELTTALGVFRDRSRQVEEANRRAMDSARRRLAEVIESISDGFALYDKDARVQVFNTRWREIAGLEDTDPTGMTLHAVLEQAAGRVDLEAYGSEEEWIRQRLAQPPGDDSSFVVHFKDGRWIDVRQFPAHDGSVVATYTDVTALKERELALARANQESEQLARELDAILEAIEFGVLIVDRDLVIKRSNRKYREIWNTPKSYLDTHPTLYEDMEWERRHGIIDVPDEEWEQYLAERVKLISADGVTPPIETTLADGTTLRRQAVPLPSGDRMITYYDVTDLTHREQQLAEAVREKDTVLGEFEAVLESIDYGIAFADVDQRVRIANRAFRELWNIPKTLTDSRPTLRHLIEYNRDSHMYDVEEDEWDDYVEDRLAGIRAGNIAPVEMHRADGQSVLYRCVALPDGVRMLTYFDITPIKQAEAALRESEERYALAMQGAQEGMWDWRAADNRILMSQRFREIVGLGNQVKWLTPATWEALVHPDDLPLHRRAMREHMLGETHQFDVECRILVQGRGERWIRNRGIGLRNENGYVYRMAGSLGSIDERKKAELALIQAKEQAEQANRVKTQFLANISHELRTPLNAVIGITEMTLEDVQDDGHDRYREPLGRVLRAGKHLLTLITELLDLSRIEAGRLALTLESVRVATLVSDAVATAGPIAEANGNRLVTRVDEDVGRINTDPTRLRQILLNLLTNACKFTDSGTVTMQVSRESAARGDRLMFHVTDTGIGMSADVLERVFEEFAQADSSMTRRYGGTGLGLTISRKLARLMDGDISVSSEPGVGSRFTLTLPARQVDAAQEDPGASVGLH